MKNFVRLALFFLMFASHALAQSALVWERQKDVSGGSDVLRSVSIAGNTAVTAGNATVTGGENVPADCPASLSPPIKSFRHALHRFQQEPKTGWLPIGIAGCFRLESLDDFDWNHWMLSIGIGG